MVRYKKLITKNKLLPVLALAVVIAACAWYFFLKDDNKPQVTTVPSTSKSQDAEDVEKGVSQKNPSSAIATSSGDKQSTGSSPASGNVASPEGNFVSSHRLSSVNSSVESVCTTTRGATCDIVFKNGANTRTLGKKTVNENGATSWVWTPASIGLYPGTWEIEAIAILGSAQSSSKDPLSLEIK